MTYSAARGSPPSAGGPLHAPGQPSVPYRQASGSSAWSTAGPGSTAASSSLAPAPIGLGWSPGASPRSLNDPDRFEDAASDDGGAASNAATASFNNGGTYQPQPQSWTSSPISQPPRDQIEAYTPPSAYSRELLLPSSQSSSTLNSSMRGRRAPAPAALDLSPRSRQAIEESQQIPEEPPGWPQPHIPARSARRLSRPLPTAPPTRAEEFAHLVQSSARNGEPVPFPSNSSPLIASSSTLPLHAPLSAFGMDDQQMSTADQRTSIASSGANGDRVSIDSYYLGAVPHDYMGTGGGLSPPPTSFHPTTPDYTDPSDIDRRGLVGVGELATPRWGATSASRHHLRTPSMPHDFSLSPPMPPLPASALQPGSLPKGGAVWGAADHSGVGVMERVTEESPRHQQRMRHRSVSHETPKRPLNESSQSGVKALDSLLSISSIGDFSFESSIDNGALAASLAMPEPMSPVRNQKLRASAPPSAKDYAAYAQLLATGQGLPSSPLPTEAALGGAPVPGSARERLYARRASRAASGGAPHQSPSQLMEAAPLPPSKMSPPNSADSQTFEHRRDQRRTPPGSREPSTSKRRPPSSPSATHHDILKLMTPKDFSHLPPSPSGASINQILKGSSSGTNLTSGSGLPLGPSLSTRTPPGSVSGHGSKSNLGRSESMRSRAQSLKVTDAMSTAEALRKLDGLGTPNKKSNGSIGSSSTPKAGSGRPVTPPETAKRLNRKNSLSSVHSNAQRGKDSPLNNWYDVGQDLPAVNRRVGHDSVASAQDLPPLTFEKRESSPSVVGTPTSRDSYSHVNSSATPPSGNRDSRLEKAPRRSSLASDMSSAEGGGVDDRLSEGFVPPVPPLPRGYQSMRQGLSSLASGTPAAAPMQYVPLHAEVPVERESPDTSNVPKVAFPSPQKYSPESTTSHETPRTRTMSKKWSFSSALNLNKLHKETAVSPPALSPSLPIPVDSPSTPQTPWSEVDHRVGLASPRAPTLQQVRSRDSVDLANTSITADARSNHSATPVAPGATATQQPAKSGSKRLAPSSIPFFRRASASSVSLAHKLASPPEVQTPRFSTQAPPPPTPSSTASTQRTPSSTRKSVLGMHLPNMLRGSASKRGLAQQVAPTVVERPEVKPSATAMATTAAQQASAPTTGSIGRAGGRARGMTLSSGGDPGSSLIRKPSVDTHYTSVSSRSESTVNGATPSIKSTKLPVAGGTLHNATSLTSLRKSDASRAPPTATPTKIPRMASRPSVVTPNTQAAHSSMPPPALPSTLTLATSQSANVLAAPSLTTHFPSTASINEFQFSEYSGNSARQSLQPGSSSAHRAHLLAPMSARKLSVSGIPQPPSTAVPVASRRDTLGAPPVSGVPQSRRTLPQLPSSATAMTISASAKARPSLSRRNSVSQDAENEPPAPQPIKSSKSLHSKMSHGAHSRLSLSASTGSTRRISMAPETSESPTDDEEAAADAEMAAYVARRKARAAAGTSSKKDDLSDLLGFPEDVDPAEAVSQRSFISRHLNSLSDYERKEVLDFDFIYYVARNVKRAPQPDGKIYNHGYDDERGDYIVVEGDHLCYRYEVISVLGKGSFGQVVHCRDHKTGGSVAVKIIRNKKRFHAQALVEVKILQQIVEWDPEDRHFMVKMTDHFYFRGHLCIVTELLSINLYELIKANQFCGFSTAVIRRFTTQMLSSLMLMRQHRIVHCDLKPENILLRHPAKSGIKVIDFGSSCHESEKVYTYIQSRFYRSPEVILGMNYAMAIDMWSLGCILAELYTGYPIFPGENEHEQLACIMEVLGIPDSSLINKASRRKLFFDTAGAPRPFVNAKGKRRRPGTRSLASVLKCNDELFVDFIAKCLTWDPDKRLKPQPAMRHPWILAGRRRQPPPPPERDTRASFLGTPSARRATMTNGDKKTLVISTPVPLVARASQAPSSASRVGVSATTARLHARNSYVPNAQKVSMA
ncbi:DYRK-family kinase pom1 [Vanrija pseudolonga]|uniref:DYRK-family kinase pom1 n=1 Tax=Vanrija pseudolonga TaxID=143232 RepID=A0AAF1BMF0_9TREE|nr:DYRK-family kinase pom1 [Vanrija pseudolonga]